MKKRTSFEITRAVIFALIIRELKTRFGFHKLGYIWAIIEPAAFVAVFWVIFEFHMRKALPGIDYPMFVLTGVVPWLMFKQIVFRTLGAFNGNSGLFQYRQVKPIDTIIARSLIEASLSGIVFILYIGLGYLLGFDIRIHDFISLSGGLFLFYIYAVSFGLTFSILGHFSENIKKTIKLIFRPLYFMSGVFFPAQSVSENYLQYLSINPILHFMELIRSSYFENFTHPHYNITFLTTLTLLQILLSLLLYRILEKKIIAS